MSEPMDYRLLDRPFRASRSLLQVFPQVLLEYDLASLPDLDAPRVLDIGACFGAFSWLALGRWPGAKVIAYEPHPGSYAMLADNFGDVVDCQHAAVIDATLAARLTRMGGAPNGLPTVRLYEGAHAATEASLLPFDLLNLVPSQQLDSFVDVPAMDVDRLEACEVLKVDTEGCELPILRGYAHLDRVRVLLVEVHPVRRDDVAGTTESLEREAEQIIALAASAGLHPIDQRNTTLRFLRRGRQR